MRLRSLLLLVLLPSLANIRAQAQETSAESSGCPGLQVAADAVPAACDAFGLAESKEAAEACARIAQAVSSGNLKMAAQAASELRDKHPEKGIGAYWLGQVDFKRARYISALRNFELAVDRSPTVVAAHVALGLSYASLQQYRLFEKEMLWVIDQAPEDPFPYYNLGRYYFLQMNQAERGAEYLRKALERSPKDYRSSYYLGYYHEMKGQLDQAKALYAESAETVRARKASYGAPMEGLSRILLQQEHLSEAIRMAQEAVELEPSLASARLLLGKLWIQSGDLVKGIAELQKAAELDPPNAAPHYQLYRAYLKLGKRAEAESAQALFLKIRLVYSEE